jgi:hypothetical protein
MMMVSMRTMIVVKFIEISKQTDLIESPKENERRA